LDSTAASRKERTLVIERVFDAPAEVVFDAWSTREHLAKWWGPNEFTLPHCEIDFRVGGSYRFCMRSPEGTDYWVWGEYQETERRNRIVMTWNRETEKGELWSSTIAEISFAAVGDKTALRLHQSLFQSTEYRDQHNGGWTQCLDRLGTYVRSVWDRSPGV